MTTPLFQVVAVTVAKLLTSGFLWLPFVFAAYAIGRRKVSLLAVMIFVTAEAAALAIYGYQARQMYELFSR